MDESDLTTLTTANPWSTSSSVLGLQLGDPQSGLVIARRHGLDPGSWQSQDEVRSRLNTCSSMRMIDTLQEISAITTELHQVEMELHRLKVDKEMADLIHLDVLKTRLSKIDSLLEHFTSVVTSKEAILSRLQSKAADNSLIIEAPYQRHTSAMLTSFGSFVSRLPVNCEKLKWTSDLQIEHTSLERRISEAADSIVQCKSEFQTCQQLHDSVAEHV